MPPVPRVTFQAVTLRWEATSIKENVSLQQAVLHACPEEFDTAGDPPSIGDSVTPLPSSSDRFPKASEGQGGQYSPTLINPDFIQQQFMCQRVPTPTLGL